MRDLGVPGASTAPLTRWGEMGSAPFTAAISEITKAVITLPDFPAFPKISSPRREAQSPSFARMRKAEPRGTRGHVETGASGCPGTLPPQPCSAP